MSRVNLLSLGNCVFWKTLKARWTHITRTPRCGHHRTHASSHITRANIRKSSDSVMWSCRLKEFVKTCLGKYRPCQCWWGLTSPKRLSMVAWFTWVYGPGKGGRSAAPESQKFSGKKLMIRAKAIGINCFRVQLLQHNSTVHLLPICRSLAIVNSMDKLIDILGQRHGREHFFF